MLLCWIQEGPHSALNEDEFFDALEMAYQKEEMVSNIICTLQYHNISDSV